MQAARILQAWCLGRALGIDLPLPTYFAFMPVILLVMQLPITVNGFGTTQIAFERLFVPAGVAAAPAFALSILFLALGIVGSLPGGVLYALFARRPAARGLARMTLRVARLAIAAAVSPGVAWIVGARDRRAALRRCIYALAVLPGLPLGFALFGRASPGRLDCRRAARLRADGIRDLGGDCRGRASRLARSSPRGSSPARRRLADPPPRAVPLVALPAWTRARDAPRWRACCC